MGIFHWHPCRMWFTIPTPPHIVNGVERGSSASRQREGDPRRPRGVGEFVYCVFFGYVLNLCCKPNQQPLCPPSGLSDVAWIRIDTLEIKACCCVHLDSKARFIPLKTGVCPCQCQLRWIESLPWGQMRKRGPLGSFLVVVWGFPKSWGGPN